MMKKFILLVSMLLFAFTACSGYAAEKPPKFTKKDAFIFYKVPDQVLMCQNKSEDMTKGAEEFEDTIREYYKKRFNVVGLQRSFIELNSEDKFPEEEKRQMFATAQKASLIMIEINLLGNGTATDTYQNVFGAKQHITVPTTRLQYAEYFGYKPENVLFKQDYGVQDYRPNTMAMFGKLWSNDMNARVLTKNCIEWYMRDVNKFNPPNKYTAPKYYESYIALYTGDANKMHSISKHYQNQQDSQITIHLFDSPEQLDVLDINVGNKKNPPVLPTPRDSVITPNLHE